MFFLQPLDRRVTVDGRVVRFTSRIGRETQRFEDELCRRVPAAAEADPEEGVAADAADPVLAPALLLPLQQRHAYLRNTQREFRLFQMTDTHGKPAMQAVIYVQRPRFPGWLAHGLAARLGQAVSPEEELCGLRILRQLCAETGELVTLRLQPRRYRIRELRDFEERARRAGFVLCDPEGVTRTLLYDLRPDPEAALLAMSQKLRRKIRARTKHAGQVEVRVLTDPCWAAACQDASGASLRRTGGCGGRSGEWESLFAVAQDRPDLLRVLGLFRKDRPDKLLAFAAACRHGEVAEYASAGSLDDPELRKLPFNYWLVWELFLWAREHGSRYIDLGGVTSGGPEDPLGGISRFKRHLTQTETEVGREMIVALRPFESWAYGALRSLRDVLMSAA